MRALEFLTENHLSELTVALGPDLFNLIKKADASLPREAERAIDTYIGIPHNGVEMGMDGGWWDYERLEDAYSTNPSERGLIIKEQLSKAFAPIEKALIAKFGRTITLYRAQKPVTAENPRTALSWTSDPHVALMFAGAPMRLPKPITDEEIVKAVSEYNANGIVHFRGKKYVRSEDNDDPDHYDIFYKNDDHVTDGDDLEEDLKSIQNFYQEIHDKREEAKKRIVTKEVDVDSIIWISDRANQCEFILLNQGSHFIGPKGI